MTSPVAAWSPIRGRGRSSLATPALIAAAWLAILAAQATGAAAALHHHALIEGGPPLWAAIPLFMLGWAVMVVAMMLPASLPTIRLVESAGATLTRPRHASFVFLLAFGVTWVTFGLLAFLGDMVVHHVVDTTPWLAARPWLIEAGVLALAGGYQFMPSKRRSLAACRHLADPATSAPSLEDGAARTGLRHGLDCLGSSWALMLLMFAEGFGSLWWMAALTGVMVYETSGRHGQRASAAVGIILLLAALTVLSSPLPGGGVTL
jgi:predicted metal-binding membrane protein